MRPVTVTRYPLLTQVCMAWLPMVFPQLGNYSALRALRALRPLRAINRLVLAEMFAEHFLRGTNEILMRCCALTTGCQRCASK